MAERHRLTEIDPEERTAMCASCGLVTIRRNGIGGWRCNPANRRAGRRAEMVQRQGGRCAICGKQKVLVYDHCHATGSRESLAAARGALCYACNSGLGHFQDDPELLRAAINYIESHAHATA